MEPFKEEGEGVSEADFLPLLQQAQGLLKQLQSSVGKLVADFYKLRQRLEDFSDFAGYFPENYDAGQPAQQSLPVPPVGQGDGRRSDRRPTTLQEVHQGNALASRSSQTRSQTKAPTVKKEKGQ